MKFFGFVWKNAWRKKIRTSLTILSVLVAFLMYVLLSAIGSAMTGGGGGIESARRLVVIDKVSLINLLPVSYYNKLDATPGVRVATHSTWFGGFYQDPKNQFAQFPIDPETYFEVYTELDMPDEQMQGFLANRTGALVGRSIAQRFGWEVGDRIPIQATIWPQRDGGRSWEFDLEGVFDTTDPRGSDAIFLFHYDYFDEARQFGQGLVGWYIVGLEDGADPVEVSNTIDAGFANSPNETETSTEQAFAASFAEQLGNIALIVQLILGAVFFTLLLVTGNTMAQSVRERIAELAVLKTLGFRDGTLLGIILAESILIMAIGGGLGILIGWLIMLGLSQMFAAMIGIGLTISVQALAGAIAIILIAGIAAGIFPALHARRLTIVDALARG